MAFAVFAVCVIFALSCSETSGTSLRVEPISLHKGHVPQKDSPGLGDNLYDFCNTSLTPLVIHTFVIKPDEIKKGETIQLTGMATLTKNITGGKIEGKITVDFIPLNLNYDLCEELKSTDYKCPLMPKDYTINQSIQIPDIVPKGDAKGTVKVTDQDGVEIACINVHAKITDI